MAASSAIGSAATIAYHIAHLQNHVSSKMVTNPRSSMSMTCFVITESQRRKRLVLRNSKDESVTAMTEAEAEAESELETPLEVLKGPPSLISALNAEKAIRGIAITDADHYGRLGLQTGCSYDQVTTAYRAKVTQVMDQGLAEEELSKELELLKESHYILSSTPERRLYDWSLARNVEPDRYSWPFQVDITQTQFEGIPPPQEPEDVEPTKWVGYFLMSWLILSVVLFVVLNTR